jgi:hypothetical protein
VVTVSDRGQAYTLEGLAAGILVLTALLFALQAVVVTPTTPGTVDRESRAELDAQVRDVLHAAHANQSLTTAVLRWNSTGGTFYSDDHEVTTAYGHGSETPAGELGALLNQSFEQRGFTYNVYVQYRNGTDRTESEEVVYVRRGEPTDNAVSASVSIALFDDMRLTSPTSNATLGATGNTTAFYARDVDDDGPLYNIVVVRVVVW